MKQSFYIYNNGDLKRKDNTLRFTSYEGEKRDIPIERISDIYVMSEMSFNTTFLNYISKYGIPIHFFNYYNFYTGSFYPKESNLAGQLLVSQVQHYTEYTVNRLIGDRKIRKPRLTYPHKNTTYFKQFSLGHERINSNSWRGAFRSHACSQIGGQRQQCRSNR